MPLPSSRSRWNASGYPGGGSGNSAGGSPPVNVMPGMSYITNTSNSAARSGSTRPSASGCSTWVHSMPSIESNTAKNDGASNGWPLVTTATRQLARFGSGSPTVAPGPFADRTRGLPRGYGCRVSAEHRRGGTPLTTADTTTHDDNAWIGDSTLGERFPAWTRGNAADVFPEPFSPLGKSHGAAGGAVAGSARRVHRSGRAELRRVRGPRQLPTCSRCSVATSTTR